MNLNHSRTRSKKVQVKWRECILVGLQDCISVSFFWYILYRLFYDVRVKVVDHHAHFLEWDYLLGKSQRRKSGKQKGME